MLSNHKKASGSDITGRVIKISLVKPEGQTNVLLIPFIIIGFIAIAYLILQTVSH